MRTHPTRLFGLALVLGLILVSRPGEAHHSFSAEFDVNKPISIHGTLTRMDWVNPHGWFYIDVKESDGKITNWAIEAGGPNALLRRGLRRTDFPIGSEVWVTGFQAKNGTPTANGRTVKLADGRDFFLGSSGTGAPSDGADPEERR
jgi:Family of unknown function (DUF6152)